MSSIQPELTMAQIKTEQQMAMKLGESEYRAWVKERNKTLVEEKSANERKVKEREIAERIEKAQAAAGLKSEALMAKRRQMAKEQEEAEERNNLRLEQQRKDELERQQALEQERQESERKANEMKNALEMQKEEEKNRVKREQEEEADRIRKEARAKAAEEAHLAEVQSEQRRAGIEVAIKRMVLVESTPNKKLFALGKDIAASKSSWSEEEALASDGVEMDQTYVDKFQAQVTAEKMAALKIVNEFRNDESRSKIGQWEVGDKIKTTTENLAVVSDGGGGDSGDGIKARKGSLKELLKGDENTEGKAPKKGLVRRMSQKWDPEGVAREEEAEEKRKEQEASELAEKQKKDAEEAEAKSDVKITRKQSRRESKDLATQQKNQKQEEKEKEKEEQKEIKNAEKEEKKEEKEMEKEKKKKEKEEQKEIKNAVKEEKRAFRASKRASKRDSKRKKKEEASDKKDTNTDKLARTETEAGTGAPRRASSETGF